MPGIPLVARETIYSRIGDQMCRPDSSVHLSAEEEIEAEESLSVYCKPVELYNILQRRAIRNPSFLQRCLHYKIQAKHKKRIQMTISLSGSMNDGVQTQRLFPVYVLLAKPVSSVLVAEHSAVYHFSRACMLTSYAGTEGMNRAQANFILPDIKKLAAEIKSGSLAILFVSFAEITNSLHGPDTKDHMDMTSFPSNVGGYCLLGKIPMELLYSSWEKSPNLSLGERVEMMLSVDMHSCFVKSSCLDDDKCISFQIPCNSGTVGMSKQVQVVIFAEEIGAKEKSRYNSDSYNDIPTSSLSNIIRLKAGNVIFNYRYFDNKLQRTEVTEDFSCPFCLVKCSSFKGLRHHLSASHDLFNFEYWVNEEYQAVNVSVKTDIWRYEIVADGVDPKQQTFFFCSKPPRRRKLSNLIQNAKHVRPLVLDSDFPTAIDDLQDKTDEFMDCDASSPNVTGVSTATAQSFVDPECVQSVPGSNLAPPAMLQFAKTRKLSIERSDPRNRALLQKRQFFHSHRAQPMGLEQVLSDRDSEDEVDDDVADFEDRRMLDDFVDVTKDEKQMMHLWNSFVRKQRVLADGHIPWACEAFSNLHGQDLVRTPALLWCWRLFMIKLWNHGLLDARTMNNCNIVLEKCQSDNMDATRS
ncbi:polycomb group protein EMBRYONIC FLOWER 2-like isoform X2 [Cornus florida]|uniref:polycomb group protein EMBRYONIC FLOWER 2-like isoform X2 n=1 Tax=Cornus florida TaxID=4283 RepID=UPI00289CBADB|nr:polycomb group protein EMBRYONIC FLOWER 2-like isoform X2 [Cornus florida]